MSPYSKKIVLVALMYLCLMAGMIAMSSADNGNNGNGCTDSGKVVAPGDTISVTGPSNNQSDLGIQWEYQWTLSYVDGNVIEQMTYVDNPVYSFEVPDYEVSTTYKLDLEVTALNDITCVNGNCVLITVNKTTESECKITPPDTNTFCTAEGEDTKHPYTTATTPAHVKQRWWIIDSPGPVSFTTSGPVGVGNTADISFHGVTPGTHWVYTGYYPISAGSTHNAPLAYCTTPVIVVAVPGNTMTVTTPVVT